MSTKLLRGGGDPSGGATAVAGLVFLIALVLTVILLESMYYRAEDAQWEDKVVAQQPEELRRVRAEQEDRLHTYRWVDAPTRTAAIPIERAMELEAGRLAAGQAIERESRGAAGEMLPATTPAAPPPPPPHAAGRHP